MRELILNGVNADGTHLLLNDENGLQYRVVLDEALIAAVRRDRSQSKPEAPVRPKEIQAMIRGGMDAEEVVAATGADIEYVRTYEGPAMAERERTAYLASRHPIYSDHDPNGEPTPLIELCQERLAMRDVDIETMEWDSWKQQDGNWYIQLSFTAADRVRTASWHYYRRSLTPIDDEAKWLADSGPTDTGPIPNYGSGAERQRNTEEVDVLPNTDQSSASIASDGPVRPTAGSAPSQQARDHQAETGRILENLRKRRHTEEEPRTRLRAVTEDPETHPQGAHTAPGQPEAATDDEVFAFEDSAPSAEEPQEPTEKVGVFDDENQLSLLNEPGVSDHSDQFKDSASAKDSKPKSKKNSRASIPSWDEIMFGSKRD
ncbi:septation protein SepH [Brevibacterium pigmentatum]|uniref:septation protein SepH n=1 Tax=Brevibacterium pigmentatum TaxID=1496080 RepID=UPI001423CA12|nr:septation protein SepH [Brevibacterium pigmentatum]